MNKLKEFYNSFAFIITFMFLSVLISALFGEKFLSKFLLLVLTSQLVLNSDKAEALIGKVKLSNEKVTTDNNNNNKTKTENKIVSGGILTENKIISGGNIINGNVLNGRLKI